MSGPKLHHYVPQSYLRRFTDSTGKLWVWDRKRDRVFRARSTSVAAESNFYSLPHLSELGHDPLTMEKQFADLEGEVAAITGQWINWIREDDPDPSIDPDAFLLPVPAVNRDMVSTFLALQFLRTEDARSILAAFAKTVNWVADSRADKRVLHAELLWNDDLITFFANYIARCTWLFGHNRTSTPFVTSDNPVAFRSSDNRKWLKAGVVAGGAYLVYPLAPDAVMYCYPDEGRWRAAKISRFDCQVSPVRFTDPMVQDENSAQVFMASRFVISNRAAFEAERNFVRTIGTDTYAPSQPDST